MLNERKFTDKQTSRDERAINSLLKQAQVSAHSGDGTSKFSQMARDRAALLRKTQKHLKKIKDSVEHDEEVISEEDSYVSADPRHPANQGGGTSRGGRMRNFPYIHTNPHTGNRVRTQLGSHTHTHPTTGEKVTTRGKLDKATRGIPTNHEVKKAGEKTNEGYGPGYGKKGLKGFRKFFGKPGKMEEAPSDENLKKYIKKAEKSEKSGRDAGFEGETASERENGVRQVKNRQRGIKNAKSILRRRASDRALDAENSFDAMDDRVVGR